VSGPRLTLSLGEDEAPPPEVVVDTEVPSGWRLKVYRYPNGKASATLWDPEGSIRYQAHYWPSIHEATESACSYLRATLEEPAAATALRASVLAELLP